MAVDQKTTDSKQELIDSSRRAIIGTGISVSYFNSHFQLINVVDENNDRRVTWKFSVGGYETAITDVIGYTRDGARQTFLHSVGQHLAHTTEIIRPIVRRRAEQLMRRCIGAFINPAVELRPYTVADRAQLMFVAQAKSRAAGSQISKPGKQILSILPDSVDTIGGEEEKVSSVIFGAVDLQTGRCTKTIAAVAP
ncbi:MAG: hypothetical protein ABR555_01045 [Pyrinomonadaceae bacterium]